ncbi:MAG TPA: site-2 protease family protein [Methylomirabilota bacterium]|jgi:membrane-associated protease RseP (regulator of RpoE activity)|nr:site-2 protease family protein [Methylomirabilota bacterium]
MADRPLAADPFTTTNGHALPRPTAPPRRHRRRGAGPLVNVALFALTCLTTLLAGTMFAGSPTFDAYRLSREPLAWMLSGVPFAATLLGILVVHEFGHYFMARARGAAVSLPYFIPAPPMIFMAGTLGAIIRMRSAARDRNALFDIAAAGPLAGLAVALPAALLGLAWSTLVPATPGPHLVFGESLLTRALMWLRFGAVPEGMVVFTHPMADAAWFGFLVTALNLLPAGQLDGGRIAYALLPREHSRLGRLTVAGLGVLGLIVAAVSYWARPEWISLVPAVNWLVLAALVRFGLGYRHGGVLNPSEPLSPGRSALGIACFVLLVLMLPPVLIHAD